MADQFTLAVTVPIRTALEPDESAISFLSRVAGANLYERVSWLFDDTQRIKGDSGHWDDETVAHLALLTGCSQEQFLRQCYRPHPVAGRLEDQRHFLDSRVPGVLLDFVVQHYCPICLAETGRNAALNDLIPINACPSHSVRLRCACHECDKPTRWGRPSVTACSYCKADLRKAEAIQIDPSHMSGIKSIAFRAGFKCESVADEEIKANWPPVAGHLDLGESIDFLSILARFATDHRVQGSFANFNEVDAHERLQIGYQQLLDWPKALFGCFDRISSEEKARIKPAKNGEDAFGVGKVFREIYNNLATAAHEPWLLLKPEFTEYVRTQWDGNIVGRRDGAVFTSEEIKDRPTMTRKEFEMFIGKGYFKTKALIDNGVIPSTALKVGKGARCFIRRADAEQLVKDGLPLLKKEVAVLLGIPFVKLTDLVESGCITPLLGKTIDNSKYYLFTRHSATDILKDIRANARPDKLINANTKFSTVMRGLETLQLSAGPVVAAMRDGTLPARGFDEEGIGLAAFLFNNIEVESFLHERHDIERGDSDGLTCVRVGQIMGHNAMTIYWMLESGLLQNSPISTDARPRIARESIASFKQKYITILEMKATIRTNGNVIRRALASTGMMSLREDDSGKHAILIYDRKEVEKHDLPSLIRQVSYRKGKSHHAYKFDLTLRHRGGGKSPYKARLQAAE